MKVVSCCVCCAYCRQNTKVTETPSADVEDHNNAIDKLTKGISLLPPRSNEEGCTLVNMNESNNNQDTYSSSSDRFNSAPTLSGHTEQIPDSLPSQGRITRTEVPKADARDGPNDQLHLSANNGTPGNIHHYRQPKSERKQKILHEQEQAPLLAGNDQNDQGWGK